MNWDTFDDLDGAGHLPWVEAPSAFRAAVAGFLTGGLS